MALKATFLISIWISSHPYLCVPLHRYCILILPFSAPTKKEPESTAAPAKPDTTPGGKCFIHLSVEYMVLQSQSSTVSSEMLFLAKKDISIKIS